MNAPGAADVSAVVCTLNSVNSIERCLESLRNNGVGEIIVVDANSTDGTREIAERLADVVLSDPRKGLGTARNIGIRRASRSYLLNCGADNVMPPGSVEALLAAKQDGAWTGVSAMTLVDGRGYLSWANRQYKMARYFPGERDVIGTPTLFDTAMLQSHPYDDEAGHSDDAELCERWQREFDARFAIVDVVVGEAGQDDLASLHRRFTMYGHSDHETYERHRGVWSPRRRVRSILHPARVELVEPMTRIGFPANLAALPYLLLATATRYLGWARFRVRHRV